MIHTYNGISFSYKEERKPFIYSKMNKPGGHDARQQTWQANTCFGSYVEG